MHSYKRRENIIYGRNNTIGTYWYFTRLHLAKKGVKSYVRAELEDVLKGIENTYQINSPKRRAKKVIFGHNLIF